MLGIRSGRYGNPLSWRLKPARKSSAFKWGSTLLLALTMMFSVLSYAASIPSSVTIDFNSSGFSNGADHGSPVFTQGNFTITYSGANWTQLTANGAGNTANLYANGATGIPDTITIQTTSGDEFDFVQFYAGAFDGGFASVEGFRDSVSTGTQTTGTGFGQTSGAFTVGLDSIFDNVDRVVITSNGSGFKTVFDSFLFNTATLPVPASLNNGKMRIGNGAENSINTSGNMQQPFYYNSDSTSW
ncbi:MAG: hypothetical protein ACRC6S_15020, partial [Shewanella sp.]